MNRPSHPAKLAALAAVSMLCAQAAWAWQPAASNQTTAQQIVFQPPVDGTCRAESGSIARGRLVSISEMEIVMINSLDRQVSFPTDGILTIRTKDGEFQYDLENDDFSDAVRRASELDGVDVVTIYIPQPTQQAPNQPGVGQGSGRPMTGGTPNRPPVGADAPPTGTQSDSSTPGFSNVPPSQTTTTPATIDTSNSSLRCASCGNVISADSRIGQTCPHCGVVWVPNPVYQSTVADTTNTHPGHGSIPVAGHGGPAPVAGQAGRAGQATTPQPATAPAPLVGQGGNFSFDAMPLWQKAGAFLGFLAVLYMVINSRRR